MTAQKKGDLNCEHGNHPMGCFMCQMNGAELAAVGDDTTVVRAPELSRVAMPPPIDRDWQVSPWNAPDWELKHFTGGVEKIERRNEMLIFHFTAGGQICVNSGVTYVAPETH